MTKLLVFRFHIKIILLLQPPNEMQKQSLISYMRTHSHFAKKQISKLGVLGNKTQELMWDKLAAKLNEIGPHKTPQQWKAVIKFS